MEFSLKEILYTEKKSQIIKVLTDHIIKLNYF